LRPIKGQATFSINIRCHLWQRSFIAPARCKQYLADKNLWGNAFSLTGYPEKSLIAHISFLTLNTTKNTTKYKCMEYTLSYFI